MKPISAASEAALRDAMKRLLDGRPQTTDGRLTVTNLAEEAGLGRATVHRAPHILATYRKAARKSDGARWASSSLKGRVKSLTAKLATTRADMRGDIAELQSAVETMAHHIAVLTLQLDEKDREIARLTEAFARQSGATIIPLGRRPRADA